MLPDDSAQDAERHLISVGLTRLIGSVAQRHVADFVPHDPGELSFVVGSFDHAAIDVEKSARQGEGIDAGIVDRLELIRVTFSGSFGGEPLPSLFR